MVQYCNTHLKHFQPMEHCREIGWRSLLANMGPGIHNTMLFLFSLQARHIFECLKLEFRLQWHSPRVGNPIIILSTFIAFDDSRVISCRYLNMACATMLLLFYFPDGALQRIWRRRRYCNGYFTTDDLIHSAQFPSISLIEYDPPAPPDGIIQVEVGVSRFELNEFSNDAPCLCGQ